MDKTQATENAAEKIDAIRLARLLLPKLIYALGGFLTGIAALPFGSFPFGIALLSAADGRALYVYVGLALACLFSLEGGLAAISFGIFTAILLFRALVRLTLDYPFAERSLRPTPRELFGVLFCERTGYRIISATLGALALGICLVVGGGFLYYDLFGLMLSLVLAPLFAYLFCAFFSKKGLFKDIGLLCILGACVWGASPIKLYGVSLAVLGALFATFIVTEKKGLLHGVICGLALGMIYSPILSPIFVISAVCIGIFMKISTTLACFCAFLCSASWGFFVKGIYALDGLFGALLSACLLYSAAHKLFAKGLDKESAASAHTATPLSESELDGIRLFDINRKMSAISDALTSLCTFFEEIKLRYPKQAELMRICRDALDSSCASCPMREGCRERGRIEAATGRLSFLLKKNRALTSADLDRELASGCSRLPDILDEINYNSGLRMSADTAFDDRDEISAPDYKALSRLLQKNMECDSNEYRIDKELSLRLCRALGKLSLDGLGAMVYGSRRRNVYVRASNMQTLEDSKENILEAVQRALPFSVDKNSLALRRCSGEGGVLYCCEADKLSVEYTSRQSRAQTESRFCGDSVSMFNNRDNRFFSLISDGMGSGREAAAVSEICTRFLESMLSVGSMNNELLSMLGGVLAGRCEGSLCEYSATVDIMELDMISGRASFFKSGAAPSYVWRGGNLFKLCSRTLPIGILHESETKRTDITLSSGDVVVMVSDGVTGGEEECQWLFDLVRQNIGSGGIDRTADLIVKYAIGKGSSDDITVAITKIL
jgi:stage II sporulation protein E